MFLYWGRRGLTQFVLELARDVHVRFPTSSTVSVSRQNECFDQFEQLGSRQFPITTFPTPLGAVTQLWRLPSVRDNLIARLLADDTQAVIDLMPHVWSVSIVDAIKATGAKYIPIVHDATVHPGDYRSRFAKAHLDRAWSRADRVITLSRAVSSGLIASGGVDRGLISTLFHPDLTYSSMNRSRAIDVPLRLLFLGRIMPYKGLGLFLDAVDILRAQGIAVHVGVCGEGNLAEHESRLAAQNAEVINRWLETEEIGTLLSRYHAVALSHTEASQSGVAATALGGGLPAIATPVGGLIEQVIEGKTGVVALRVDASAFAEAAARLVGEPGLHPRLCAGIVASRAQRSMARFVDECLALV